MAGPLVEVLTELASELARRDPQRAVDEARGRTAAVRWWNGVDHAIAVLLRDHGLLDDAPRWIVDFWRAVLAGGTSGRVSVPRDALGAFGEVASMTTELCERLPIACDDYGEGVTFDLPTLGVRAWIGREGRDGGFEYEVGPR